MPARADRDGLRRQSGADRGRRADHGAGRGEPGQRVAAARRAAAQHDTAMLLITHDLRLAAHVCDDITVLYAGEQVEYGPAREVLSRSRHPYTWALDQATPDVRRPAAPVAVAQRPDAGVSALGIHHRLPLRRTLPAARSRPARQQPPALMRTARPAIGCAAESRDACEFSRTTASAEAVPATSQAPDRRRLATPLVELQDATLRYTARRGLLGQRKVHNFAVDRLVAHGAARRIRRHRGGKRQRQKFGGAADRRGRGAHRRPAAD